MRKAAFCIGEKKGRDQLHGIRAADQRFCFPYIDSTIPLLSKSKISSLWPSTVAVQHSLSLTWSESFLVPKLISDWFQVVVLDSWEL